MNSKLIIYLMAGVGVIFMGIVVAYVILSKKLKASDTMQIKQFWNTLSKIIYNVYKKSFYQKIFV